MARKLLVALAVLGILLLGVAMVRAAAWTPVAPASLPTSHWMPMLAEDPATWQTLANATFEAGGGSFLAELQGFRMLASNGMHAFQVRVFRTGGEDARLEVAKARFDGNPAERAPEREPHAILVTFPFTPMREEMSVAADLELRAWRPAALGFVEVERVALTLPAQIAWDRPYA